MNESEQPHHDVEPSPAPVAPRPFEGFDPRALDGARPAGNALSAVVSFALSGAIGLGLLSGLQRPRHTHGLPSTAREARAERERQLQAALDDEVGQTATDGARRAAWEAQDALDAARRLRSERLEADRRAALEPERRAGDERAVEGLRDASAPARAPVDER